MSEDNNNLGDDLKKGAEDAFDDAKEAANDIAEGAKETANEFADGIKDTFNSAGGDNKKMIAGLLGIFLGCFGIHKFILGYQQEGFIHIGITIAVFVLSCFGIGLFFSWAPFVIGLAEGIIYLTKSDEEFYQTYQVGKKPWF